MPNITHLKWCPWDTWPVSRQRREMRLSVSLSIGHNRKCLGHCPIPVGPAGCPNKTRPLSPATETRYGPTQNFREKCRKNTPRPKIWNPKTIPPKYPQNTQNWHFWYLGVFFRYFQSIWGVNSGSPEFRSGGSFFGFFLVEIPGRAISGLRSRLGRSQDFC